MLVGLMRLRKKQTSLWVSVFTTVTTSWLLRYRMRAFFVLSTELLPQDKETT